MWVIEIDTISQFFQLLIDHKMLKEFREKTKKKQENLLVDWLPFVIWVIITQRSSIIVKIIQWFIYFAFFVVVSDRLVWSLAHRTGCRPHNNNRNGHLYTKLFIISSDFIFGYVWVNWIIFCSCVSSFAAATAAAACRHIFHFNDAKLSVCDFCRFLPYVCDSVTQHNEHTRSPYM